MRDMPDFKLAKVSHRSSRLPKTEYRPPFMHVPPRLPLRSMPEMVVATIAENPLSVPALVSGAELGRLPGAPVHPRRLRTIPAECSRRFLRLRLGPAPPVARA